MKNRYNKRLKGTVNARRFQSHWAAVVSVVVFEFSGMRCQPLRRALTGKMEMPKASEQKGVANVSLWAMPSFRKS
ncbi:hypothetical protein CGT68_18335 [Vibrio cholerae]|nr:hypothetical protein CGT68_18335 [Vibrio cholerae]